MRDRFFLVSHRVRLFLVSLGIVALAAPAATGSLKKYDVRRSQQLHYFNTSPEVEFQSVLGLGKGLIDDSGAAPVLKKLLIVSGGASGRTVIVPQLSGGFIWFNEQSILAPADNQTGSGSTASSITWGDLTGWTITGAVFCHAIPSYVCDLAQSVNDDTIDAVLISTHYDIGTWTFHGTGFTNPEGFIHRTSTSDEGNLMYMLRGHEAADGTVPALPLLGISAVGVSVLAMGVASMRRRRK